MNIPENAHAPNEIQQTSYNVSADLYNGAIDYARKHPKKSRYNILTYMAGGLWAEGQPINYFALAHATELIREELGKPENW